MGAVVELNERALREYLNEAATQRSVLGELDCVRFAVEALHAGWRVDYRERLKYFNRRMAVDRLRNAGGLVEAFDEHLERCNTSDLQPGDFAYFPDPCVGIVLPTCVAVKWRKTIVRVPVEQTQFGWKSWDRY